MDMKTGWNTTAYSKEEQSVKLHSNNKYTALTTAKYFQILS